LHTTIAHETVEDIAVLPVDTKVGLPAASLFKVSQILGLLQRDESGNFFVEIARQTHCLTNRETKAIAPVGCNRALAELLFDQINQHISHMETQRVVAILEKALPECKSAWEENAVREFLKLL